MKASLLACLLCASASAASFDFDILSHITFSQPWTDWDVGVLTENHTGDADAFITAGWSGNYWAQGAHAHGVNDGTALAELSVTFYFYFATPTALTWETHSSHITTNGNGSVVHSIIGEQGDGFTGWHSVTLVTRAQGTTEPHAVADVPDDGTPLFLVGAALVCLHQFNRLVLRRSRPRTGDVPAAGVVAVALLE